MFYKIHEAQNQKILAVCDKNHLGKTFEDGKIFFEARESFYKGEPIDEAALEKLFDEADSINLFGEKCVGVAEKKGLVGKVLKIKGVPHAQVYKVID